MISMDDKAAETPPSWQGAYEPDPGTAGGIDYPPVSLHPQPGQQGCFRSKEPQDSSHPSRLEDLSRQAGEGIIGRSPALKAALRHVAIVAPTNAAVLILGETGTGKELIARAIHRLSSRRDSTLTKLSCAAIPAGLLESELFGYERGAFTGAAGRRIGRFEMAHQGTLFLDEVGDFPPELQPKLLRALQEKEFERLGGNQTYQVNVRVVAATSRDLSQMVAERQFRSDLYYRLSVFPIRIPTLRERPEDIPLLACYFVNHFARQMNKRIDTIPQGIMDSLKRHHWPGNVRELENFIERSVIMSNSRSLTSLSAELERSGCSNKPEASRPATLEECERDHILRTLQETRWLVGGSRGAAARLGLRRTTLIWKMQKLGIVRKPKPVPGPIPQPAAQLPT